MTLNLNDPTLLKTQCFVGGEWVSGSGQLEVFNPATGKLLATVETVGSAETEQAIEAADRAMKAWQKTSAKERAVLLRNWYDLIMENQEDLATILTAEQGKSLAESRGEVAYSASYAEWFAEEARRNYGDTLAMPQTDRRGLIVRQPVGVVAAMIPWNFPSLITRKICPALAAGCGVVLKPSEETPLSALAMIELGRRAGIPAGLVSVVVADNPADIGDVLTASETVKKLTFTGSTAVGKMLAAQCAGTVKKLTLELGGNAPFIVFDDADLEAAAQNAALSKFRNAGQVCVCAQRIFVQEGIYDKFVARLKEIVQDYRVGNCIDESNTHGPQIHERSVLSIEEKVQDAIAKGAKVVLGGKRGEQGPNFYQPTILTNVDDSMRVFKEEIFGPVAAIYKFKTEEEAIQRGNDTEYGLAAYFYTRDLARAWRVSEALDFGMVGVNETVITADIIPFGGMKQSGIGREGSRYGLEEFTEMKFICMGGLDQ
ncbi:succinate-semialdehyde dehydrogenase / glutarate-semialdehyde dehydrogenase [Microbulbifer donghaiensis]|uniref:Succinate-semialdehyde dehydrogenase / glutarate-semialdehyde dehydrogenase n=1 Tax=Microbulbifer donghaiensis TaxID=494016 RepID=A0A1M4UJY2_9GAMM|nr:NAD-dependent succinate-semialdehyde dehydrogenase [Microbulbifer donghaiensis]SHE56974.1 succinate-semialdehyde dehydrogenase / glutarate-semialdehyde dehydrogenase [Microbulbifer donghaiensis]